MSQQHDSGDRHGRDDDQRQTTRASRETGGDAEAAGTIEEREAVARQDEESDDGDA